MINIIAIKLIENAYRHVSMHSLRTPQLARWVSLLTKRNTELMLEYGNHFELQFSNFSTEVARLLNHTGIDSPECREQIFKNYRYCPFSSFLYSAPIVTLQELQLTVSLINDGFLMLLPNKAGEIPYLKITSNGQFFVDSTYTLFERAVLAECPAMLGIPKDLQFKASAARLHFESTSPQFGRYADLLVKAAQSSAACIENDVYFNLALLDSAILSLRPVFENAATGSQDELKMLIDCWKPAVSVSLASDAERIVLMQESELNFNAGWFIQLNSLSPKRRVQVLESLCNWPECGTDPLTAILSQTIDY